MLKIRPSAAFPLVNHNATCEVQMHFVDYMYLTLPSTSVYPLNIWSCLFANRKRNVVGEQGSQVELHNMQTPRYDSRHGDGQVEADDQCNIVDEDTVVDEECKEQ